MSAVEHASQPEGRPPVVVAPNLWMRKRRRTAGSAACAFITSAAWVAMFFGVALSNPHLTKTAGEILGVAVFLFGVAALSGTYGVRLARSGLWLAADGVRVRGPLKTRHIALDDIKRFEPGIQAGAGANGTPCPMLVRANGSRIGVWALGREGLATRYRRYLDELQPLCDDLNRLLQSLRTTSGRRPTDGGL
jgi:hypothetical protein